MIFKWFYFDSVLNKGRVFITEGFVPKNVSELVNITETSFTTEDGPFLVLVNGVVQIDPIKKAAYDQLKLDKATADQARQVTEKQILDYLKTVPAIIDSSSLEAPIKTLLKRMVKLLIRDL